jgi:hypothetical protein
MSRIPPESYSPAVNLSTSVTGTLQAAQAPAFTGGDVTSSAGSLALTIADDAVTYAKMQNVSAQYRLLGRSSSGAGNVEEITTSSVGLTLLAQTTAGAIQAAVNSTKARSTATSGTVTIAADTQCQILAGSGTITCAMPVAPIDNQIQKVTLETGYTAITMSGNGKTIVGATIGITAGSFATWQYFSSTTTWYRIG